MKKITIIENTYYTRDEVAEILQVNIRTIDTLIKKGVIKAVKIGASIRFLGKTLLELGEVK